MKSYNGVSEYEELNPKAKAKIDGKKKVKDLFPKDMFDDNAGTGTAMVLASEKAASSAVTTKYVPRCYESHKPFKLGGGVVYGGNCGDPVDDCDVYIALDSYVFAGHRAPYPWEKPKKKPFIAVQFRIPDMGVPPDTKNFKAMIEWLCTQLQEGKHVHIGCIGGHGRTGMVLAALVRKIKGTEDAITWVRKHYCKKAVETTEQINYLHKHYGITKVEPSKHGLGGYTGSYYSGSYGGSSTGSSYTGVGTTYKPAVIGQNRLITPVPSNKSMYGPQTS